MMDELIAKLSDESERARNILKTLDTTTLLDLDDMQMHGEQILTAYYAYCGADKDDFTAACSLRDPAMVEYVNHSWLDKKGDPEKLCRQHGPQKTIPAVNSAVNKVLDDAAKAAVLEQLDDGAEYVNLFFISLLKHMQRTGDFSGKMRVNLGTGDGTHAVFMVYLAELQDSDGNPLKFGEEKKDGAE